MIRRALGIATLASVLVLVPVAALWGIRSFTDERVEGIDLAPRPVVMAVDATEEDFSVPGQLQVSWEAPRTLRSPVPQGIVTKVYVRRGDRIGDGDRVLQVDGVDRIAVRTESPFYRPLHVGSRGEDVVALERWLVARELLDDDADDYYGTATGAAVEILSVALGAERTTEFAAEWIVWLPAESLDVGSVAASIGSMAPPLGEDLIAEPRRIRRADLAVSEGFTAPPGDLVMVVRDTRVALGLDGSVTTPEAVVLLGELLSPEDTVIGVEIATLRPVQVVRAPVTAVMSGGEGSLCVWLDATDGFEERKVVVVSSTVSGVALVTDGLVSGDRVLVNPASILLDPTCT